MAWFRSAALIAGFMLAIAGCEGETSQGEREPRAGLVVEWAGEEIEAEQGPLDVFLVGPADGIAGQGRVRDQSAPGEVLSVDGAQARFGFIAVHRTVPCAPDEGCKRAPDISEYVCSRGADVEPGEQLVATIYALNENECAISIRSETGDYAAPKGLVERCDWSSSGKAAKSDLDDEFADTSLHGGGPVRPILSDETVAPGDTLWAAVRNDLFNTVAYGPPSHIETVQGDRVGRPRAFRAPLFFADANSIGPCVPISIPRDAEPGLFLAVIEDVQFPDDTHRDIKAPFVVTGAEPGF